MTPVIAHAAGDDDYLEAIEMETEKVERTSAPRDETTAGPKSPESGEHQAGEGFSSGLSIEEFELELTTKYTGTGRFYAKLPRRTQEEVYQEYLDGASISDIRKKVMSRYLKR